MAVPSKPSPLRHISFSGRASRAEYWITLTTWFYLSVTVGLSGLILGVDLKLAIMVFLGLLQLALSARRLHDIGKSGWFQLIGLLPVLGGLALLWLTLQPGEPKENRFGPPERYSISKFYLTFAYLLNLIFPMLLIGVVIQDQLEEPLKVTLTLALFVPFSYGVTYLFSRMSDPAPLRFSLLTKRYLGFAGLILLTLLSATVLLSEMRSYDLLETLFRDYSVQLVSLLVVILLTYPEMALIDGGGIRRVPLTLILIFSLSGGVLLDQMNLYRFWQHPHRLPEAQTAFDRLRVVTYKTLLSLANDQEEKRQLFRDVLEAEYVEFIDYFLDHGQDPNIRPSYSEQTPYLWHFIQADNLDLADRLLAKGAAIDWRNDAGSSILDLLLILGRAGPEQVRWLQQRHLAISEKTARHLLAYADIDTLRPVIELYADFPELYRQATAKLHYAPALDDEDGDEVKRLIGSPRPEDVIRLQKALLARGLTDHGIDDLLNASLGQYLADALEEENLTLAHRILETGDPSLVKPVKDDATALFFAAQAGDLKTARYLLSQGVDVNQKNQDDRTALAIAIFHDQPEMMQLLIEHGAKLTIKGPTIDVPLLLAAEKPSLLQRLLQAGADPDVINSVRGETVLHTAAGQGNLEIARLMLDAGANPNTTNRWQDTPLLTAVDKGHTDVVKLLISRQADLEIPSEYDQATPLIKAIKSNHMDIARELILAGANVEQADRFNNTPLSLAKDPELIALLEQRGAKRSSQPPEAIIDKYEQAYQAGDTSIPYELARYLDESMHDDASALTWYEKAHELGDSRVTERRIGQLHEALNHLQEAERWYRSAIGHQETPALADLAHFYRRQGEPFKGAIYYMALAGRGYTQEDILRTLTEEWDLPESTVRAAYWQQNKYEELQTYLGAFD